MHLKDDVKKCFVDNMDKQGVIMSGTWRQLLSIGGVTSEDLWNCNVIPPDERSLWNAKLYCKFRVDDSNVFYIMVNGRYEATLRLTITWLQDLPSVTQ